MVDAQGPPAVAPEPAPAPDVHKCGKCHQTVDEATFAAELRVCGGCGHHSPLTALEWIDHLADSGTFREIASASSRPIH